MSRRDQFLELAQSAPHVLPSLLLCDFGNLEREVAALTDAGVQGLHLDVMDGNFVPNLTYGMPLVEAFRRLTEMPLDVHLMIERPQRYIQQFCDAGADCLTIHVESTRHPRPALEEIRRCGVAAGITLNPGTPLADIENCLDLCDLVLVMSVEAGFGGQSFHPGALKRLAQLRQMLPEGVLLEVDGGINSKTIGPCAEAGAQLFVVGSAIFRADNYQAAVDQLTDAARAQYEVH